MEFCKRLDQRDLLRAGETPRLQPVDLLALLTDLTGDAGAFFVALKLPLAGLLRRFRELTRVCFPKVTHLTGNQACN
jgi:hypothetical protein